MLKGVSMSNDGLAPSKWILIVLVALAPLWMTGLYGRGYWTPDEPREADIAWRMSIQSDKTLPQLADQLFLEKPPLSYWLSAAAMHMFGDTPASARTPNLIYAIVTSISVWLLVYAMSGAVAASFATLFIGSACIVYQVAMWLAPDASLLAGCAVSLLGLYRGYVAVSGREKLLWYTLMHAGALIGFMAKSAVGWAFPGLTLFVLLLWERRWIELTLWQLWAGLILQVTAIGLWIYSVWRLPEGAHALAVLFWNNLAGRFTDIHASGALDYASGHQNWPGKYWLELPYYLFPWTLLVGAAIYRAWARVQLKNREGTCWRFAVAASLPFLMLLSMATTARGIYAAPCLLGLAVMVGLWVPAFLNGSDRVDVWAVRITRILVAIFVVIIFCLVCLLAITGYSDSISLSWLGFVLVALILIAATAWTMKQSMLAEQQRSPMSIGWCYAIYTLTMVMAGLTLFPVLDQVQNLPSIAVAIRQDASNRPLALLQPDETTIAMMDYRSGVPMVLLNEESKDALALAKQWFDAHPTDGLLLVRLPGTVTGALQPLVHRFYRPKHSSDGIVKELQDAQIGQLVKRYELPLGRRYALVERIR